MRRHSEFDPPLDSAEWILQRSFWTLKQRRTMTGPSLDRPQFFHQEVWEGGTPLKAGWRGKFVHFAHDNEDRGHIWPPYQSQEQE